jgi:hypothetical protein
MVALVRAVFPGKNRIVKYLQSIFHVRIVQVFSVQIM